MVVRCDPATVAFVETLHAGAAFAEAAAAASALPGFDPGATLSLLMAHGALSTVTLHQEVIQ
jgi:hypothetical protein